MSGVAVWLDTVFKNFDTGLLRFYHSVNQWGGTFFNPFMRGVSLLGTGASFIICLSLFLILFKPTRFLGIAGIVAVGINALIVNVAVKRLVARARPYLQEEIKEWWQAAGAFTERDYSFPSGHVSALTAGLFAMSFIKNKPWLYIVSFISVIIMGISRNYLMAHYPTDVIFGALFGLIAAFISYFLIRAAQKSVDKHPDNRFCRFVSQSDIRNVFKRKKCDQ